MPNPAGRELASHPTTSTPTGPARQPSTPAAIRTPPPVLGPSGGGPLVGHSRPEDSLVHTFGKGWTVSSEQ
jgi:hypothetical protein